MFKTQSIDLVFKLKTSFDKKGATTMLIITKKGEDYPRCCNSKIYH